jgi:hypothetical protein
MAQSRQLAYGLRGQPYTPFRNSLERKRAPVAGVH